MSGFQPPDLVRIHPAMTHVGVSPYEAAQPAAFTIPRIVTSISHKQAQLIAYARKHPPPDIAPE
jgi:hypothetical protein